MKTETTKATAVYMEGPLSDFNYDGDEFPFWNVFIGDADGESVGKIYKCFEYAKACNLCEKIARDRGLFIELNGCEA